ncbi:MAG: hypothetical protein J6V06_03665 [Clostridia bacterium]|nr:hypothetical protein [Clostridia bacterium]
MKKVLAVLLSVVMLFSAFSTCVFATEYSGDKGSLIDTLRETGVINSSQVILSFDLQSGAVFGSVPVYNATTKKFEHQEGVTGIYHLVPDNSQTYTGTYGSKLHTAGTSVLLPSVIPPSGKVFDGWEYRNTNGDVRVYTAGSRFIIPEGDYQAYSDKAILYFTALYSPAPIEKDIMDVLLGVLIEVAGKLFDLLGIDIDISGLIGGLL